MPDVRRRLRALASLLVPVAIVGIACVPRVARADVSSWLAIGGGYGMQHNHDTGAGDTAGAISYSMGVGSSPLSPLVVGLLFRGTTMVGLGTDVGAAIRASTGGFARGGWGLALDAGALWRSWGSGSDGNWPLQGVLTLGAPWGLQLAVAGQVWSLDGGNPAQGVFVALEIDLLRLTLMRQGTGEQWWPNPNPAGGRMVSLAW
jgi:hypothetical protein